ncbi:MAG: DUF1573 domain-containing protein [Flavobacteriales bacterium]
MKKSLLFLGFLFFSYLFMAQGPLSGTFVINKGEIEAKWGDSIIFVFNVKNSGTKSINILDVVGSCTCQTPYPSNIQKIQPGKTGYIKVKLALNKSVLADDLVNGIIDYDKSVIVYTNGKKEKYQLYCRAKIKIKK